MGLKGRRNLSASASQLADIDGSDGIDGIVYVVEGLIRSESLAVSG